MVEQCLYYGELKIHYKVFFVPGRQQKVAIHVYPDGTVQVDAPPQVPLIEVKKAVSKRSRWLCNQLDRTRQQYANVLPREYVSGESHLYLGRRYVLKICKSNSRQAEVKLRQGQLQLVSSSIDHESIKEQLWGWYKNHAIKLFDRRLENICANLSWVTSKPEWKLLKMRKQWGSCSPKGALNLNPHLVKAPIRCIDYVLLHELCHLKIHNHSPQFYRLLFKHMPEWEAAKMQLDGMAEILLNE